MKVHFTEILEFCDEMKKDQLQIERGIVRLTLRYQQSKTITQHSSYLCPGELFS